MGAFKWLHGHKVIGCHDLARIPPPGQQPAGAAERLFNTHQAHDFLGQRQGSAEGKTETVVVLVRTLRRR